MSQYPLTDEALRVAEQHFYQLDPSAARVNQHGPARSPIPGPRQSPVTVAGIAIGAVVLAVVAVVLVINLEPSGTGDLGSTAQTPGTSAQPTSAPQPASGSVGANGSASFLGEASNAVLYIQWTRSGQTVTGSLQEDVLKAGGGGMDSNSGSFTGTVAGNGITLQFGGATFGTAVNGQVSGTGFVLTVPGASQGSLINVSFQPAQVSDYNQAVARLEESQYGSPCTLQLSDHDAQVTFSGQTAAKDCSTFVNAQQGGSWATGTSSATLTTICVLRNGTETAEVQDDGGQYYGEQTCSYLVSVGWHS